MPEIVYGNVRVPVSEHTAALYEWQRLDLIKHPSNRNPPRWWFTFRIGAYRKAGTHSGGSALDERILRGTFETPPSPALDVYDSIDETMAADEGGSGVGGGDGSHGNNNNNNNNNNNTNNTNNSDHHHHHHHQQHGHPAHQRHGDKNGQAGGGGDPCEKLCLLREYFKAPLRCSWQPISWSWERHAALEPHLVRDVDTAVLIYSVASRASFEGLREIWDVYRAAQKPAPAGVVRPVMVVACKADLPRVEWAVSEDEGLRFADAIGAMFTRTSAREDFGVREVYAQMLVWTLAFNFKLQQAWQSDGHDPLPANRY